MTVETFREVTRTIEGTGERAERLDQWARMIQSVLNASVEQGGPAGRRFKDWLNGVWLGHPLHSALTDVPLGAWTTGAILDVVGKGRHADAAIAVGVLAAIPTALSGAADWSDTSDEPRRLGLLHALLNTGALGCFIASLFARRSEHRPLGIGLSTTGLTLAGFSAWLGGELVYRLGTGVDHTAFMPTAEDFQVAARVDSLVEGKLVGGEISVDGDRIPVVLLKRGSRVLALNGVCSHLGGPLAEGKLIDDDCVQCPWHGSRFSMADGKARQGPATAPQPAFEARISGENVEVRARR